jgi:hypothetical protein
MSIDIKKEIAEGRYLEYHIAIETLIKFEVECTKDQNDEIIIRYPFGNGNYKECKPQSKDKWKTINHCKIPNPPFGFNKLPETGKIIVFTGGEKDVLAFDMWNIPAISMQSETVNIPVNLVEELRKRFEQVMICYDIDKAGVDSSKKWEMLYGLPRIVLPDDINGKDMYDFVSSGKTKKELMNLIETTIENYENDKTYFSGAEVLALKNNNEYIIDGILPKSNLVGLIGGSDTGKSLFLLQFVISYILSKPILGFEVKGGKSVLFFCFEDDAFSIKNRLGKLLRGLSEEEQRKVGESLFFEFDPERIEEKIENHMEKYPETGVIIIDPLAEVLQGTDMNSASSVRESMQPLKKACIKYRLAVIFLHHITKSSEGSGKLNKSNSNGSQAIEAKSRVMFEMKKKSNPISQVVELGIVKGNDVDERYKSPQKSLNLELNRNSLWFEILENLGPLPDENKKIEINWINIFGQNKVLKTKEILDSMENQEQNLTQRQKENLISENLSMFRVSRGVYRNPLLTKETANAGAPQ